MREVIAFKLSRRAVAPVRLHSGEIPAMRASACVGRVGFLAAVLGTGVAVTVLGAPSAWAAPNDSVASSSDSAASEASASRPMSRSSGQRRGGWMTNSGPVSGTTRSASKAPHIETPPPTATTPPVTVSKSDSATNVPTPTPSALRPASAADALKHRATAVPTSTGAESESLVGQPVTAGVAVEPVAARAIPIPPAPRDWRP